MILAVESSFISVVHIERTSLAEPHCSSACRRNVLWWVYYWKHILPGNDGNQPPGAGQLVEEEEEPDEEQVRLQEVCEIGFYPALH